MLALATEYGFARYVARGTLLRGLALVAQGRAAEGLVQMQQGLAAYRATGTAVSMPDHLAQVAAVYGQVGQVAAGLALIAEALAMVQQTGECREEAEVHRVHGLLLLRQTVPAVPAATTCFQQALAVARRQQAQSYELRAATSLARLWQHQHQHTAAAYELLAPVYGWFREGFDTADLPEARALLEELKPQACHASSVQA